VGLITVGLQHLSPLLVWVRVHGGGERTLTKVYIVENSFGAKWPDCWRGLTGGSLRGTELEIRTCPEMSFKSYQTSLPGCVCVCMWVCVEWEERECAHSGINRRAARISRCFGFLWQTSYFYSWDSESFLLHVEILLFLKEKQNELFIPRCR